MECACVRYTELPGSSKLFLDFLYHPDRVQAFYPHLPHDPESFRAAASQINLPTERRAALVEALAPLNPGSANLKLLAEPDTVAVVTGQQVGLFSGPAYTIHKALTAVALARHLTELGMRAVPVFWLATEDHDFEEVNHAWVYNAQRQPVRLQMSRSAANQPVGDVTLPQPPIDDLRAALSGFSFAEEVVEHVAAAYQPGVTAGQAFGALLKSLLAPFDLIHIDPMSQAFRQLAAPAVRHALDAAPDLTSALLQRNQELAAAGYHAQVHVEPQTSLFFLLENGKRLTLRRQGDGYAQNGRRITTQELKDRAYDISPNALLRPVLQDSVLPTVSYIGGPAELAYLAQSEVIYRRILGRMPVPLHRSGFTILDSRSKKLMARYDLSLPDFFQGEENLKQAIASRLVPPAIGESVAHTRTAVQAAMETLSRDLAGFDAGIAAALQKSRRKIEYQVAKMEKKIGRESMARDSRAAADATALYNLIYPHRHLQERLYSILPFLAQHGPSLIDDLYANIHFDCPDHKIVTV